MSERLALALASCAGRQYHQHQYQPVPPLIDRCVRSTRMCVRAASTLTGSRRPTLLAHTRFTSARSLHSSHNFASKQGAEAMASRAKQHPSRGSDRNAQLMHQRLDGPLRSLHLLACTQQHTGNQVGLGCETRSCWRRGCCERLLLPAGAHPARC